MSLKYNSRQALEEKLQILKCCIGTKAIEVSNAIGLGLNTAQCLIEELEILTAYHETLNCYYPYDCYVEQERVSGGEGRTDLGSVTVFEESDIATWVGINNDDVVIRIYRPITNDYIDILNPNPAYAVQIARQYIHDHALELGWTVSNTTSNNIASFGALSCLLAGNTNKWGVDFINVTLGLTIVKSDNLTGNIVCEDVETECCNLKLIPEQVSYTLNIPQSLESYNFGILDVDAVWTTWMTNGDSVSIKIYNALTNTTITIPYIYTDTTLTSFYAFIANYINTNRFALGYTLTSFHGGGGQNNVLTMVDCFNSTTGNWGFDVINNTTPTTLTYNFAPTLTSTCADFIPTVDREESYECVEQCITDEEAEKMMRHAMSFCECCLETKIDNEPFN